MIPTPTLCSSRRRRPQAAHCNAPVLLVLLGAAIAAFGAVVGSANADLTISYAREPQMVVLELGPAERVVRLAEDRRDALAARHANVILNAAASNPERLITLRLRGTPPAWSDLSAAQQRRVLLTMYPFDEDEWSSRHVATAERAYEENLASMLGTMLRSAIAENSALRVSVRDLPVEPGRAGLESARATNRRYIEVIRQMDAFVLSKGLILVEGSLTETASLERAAVEAMRLRRSRPIYFRTNGAWRIATGESGSSDSTDDGGAIPLSGEGEAGATDVATEETSKASSAAPSAGRLLTPDEIEARRQRNQPPPPPTYTFHWGVNGDYESDLDIDSLPIRRDVVTFYQAEIGMHPVIMRDGELRNGGVPQAMDMDLHLLRLERDLDERIPDPQWIGYGVIDYEEWPPFWDGVKEQYKELSRELIRQANPTLPAREVEARAKAAFEAAVRDFFITTLRRCRELRPNVKWGFYLNYLYFSPQYDPEEYQWLWDEFDAFFPTIYPVLYSVERYPENEYQARASRYQNRVVEWVSKCRTWGGDEKPVLPYATWRYHRSNDRYGLQPLNDLDLDMMIKVPESAGASGTIIWDAPNTQDVVEKMQRFIDNKLGQAIFDFIDELDGGTL